MPYMQYSQNGMTIVKFFVMLFWQFSMLILNEQDMFFILSEKNSSIKICGEWELTLYKLF